MESLYIEFSNKEHWYNKAETLLRENGIPAAVDRDKFTVNRRTVKISLKPLLVKRDKKIISKLKKLKNWNKTSESNLKWMYSHLEFEKEVKNVN